MGRVCGRRRFAAVSDVCAVPGKRLLNGGVGSKSFDDRGWTGICAGDRRRDHKAGAPDVPTVIGTQLARVFQQISEIKKEIREKRTDEEASSLIFFVFQFFITLLSRA